MFVYSLFIDSVDVASLTRWQSYTGDTWYSFLFDGEPIPGPIARLEGSGKFENTINYLFGN
jgi:hypothetical protein